MKYNIQVSLGVAVGSLLYDVLFSSNLTIDFYKAIFMFIFVFIVLSLISKKETK